MRRGWLLDLGAWRDPTTTAVGVAELCSRHGLVCVGQERISWEHGRFLTDAFTIFTRPGSRWDRAPIVVDNPGFGAEAHRMRHLWAPSTWPSPEQLS